MKRTILLAATACTVSLSCNDAGLSSPGLVSFGTRADVVVPGAWVNVASPGVTRFTSGVAAGPDGRIYAAGGQAPGGVTAAAEVYDPATDVWTAIAPLPATRILHASALGGDGRIYQITGAVAGLISNSVVAYDPATNAWSTAAPLPGSGRHWPGAATGLDGRIYVAGGRVPLPPTSFAATALAAVYDPATNVWTSIAPLPAPVYAPAMATGPNGLIYVMGGTGLPTPVVSTVYAYDPATDTWSTVASLPGTRVFAAAARGTDGHIYLFGGQSVGGGPVLSTTFAYDVVANTWTPVGSLNTPRLAHGGALGSDGRIYAVGGGSFSTVVNLPTEAYGPIPNQAPTANAGADQIVSVVGTGGADVTLDGSASSDPDDGIATYEWFENAALIATGVAPTVHLTGGTHNITLRVTDNGALFSEDVVVVTVHQTVGLFLHGIGAAANPPVLRLDAVAPTAGKHAAKHKDSPSIKFAGGNRWKDVGTWTAAASLTSGSLSALGDVHAWIGLKDSDDQGTRFDVRIEILKNGSVVAMGETHCIRGVTRKPHLAKKIKVRAAPFSATSFNGTTDVLSLRVSTRVGTNGSGEFCGGHKNAVGLRVYFDAAKRASKFDGTF